MNFCPDSGCAQKHTSSIRDEGVIDIGHQRRVVGSLLVCAIEQCVQFYPSAQSSNVFTFTRPRNRANVFSFTRLRNRAMCLLLPVCAIEQCVYFYSSAQSSNVFTFTRPRNRVMCSLLPVRAIE